MLARSSKLSLAALFLTSGCAVLTVDVDVYKGPLANHEQVQMEQLAVMATAAKPLLIRLRDDLEDEEWERNNGAGAENRPDRHCYLDKERVTQDGCLKSQDAKLVNAILGLYSDQADTRFSSLLSAWANVLGECRILKESLDDFESDRELWDRVAPHASGADREGFENLLNTAPGKVYRNIDLANRIEDPLANQDHKSSTLKFLRLTDRAQVEALVRTLIPDQKHAKLRAELVDRVTRIGDEYLRGRELMDRALVLGLDLIVALETDRSIIENRAAIIDQLSNAVATLVQPEALDAASGLESIALERAALKEAFDLSKGILRREDASEPPKPGALQRASSELRTLLRARPMEAAQALRSVHYALKAGPKSEAERQALDKYSDLRRCQFGVARALTLTPTEADDVEKIASLFTAPGLVANLGQFGLDRARLPEGLETLIKRYLLARKSELGGLGEAKADKRRLADELTHFAEKILFVVNNDAVVRACKEPGDECRESYVMVLESIGNSILTLNDALQHAWKSEDNAPVAAQREMDAAKLAWRIDPATMLDDIVRMIQDSAEVPEVLVREERTAWKAAVESRKRAEEALAKAAETAKTAAEAGLEAAREAEVAAEKKAAARIAVLRTASAKVIEKVRQAVLAEATATGAQGKDRSAMGELVARSLRAAGAQAVDDRPDYDQAAAFVESLPLARLTQVALPKDPKKPTEVLDSVIASLRAARVAETAKGSDTSALAKQLDQAIAAAEAYRSPLVYIRPPASFLRNSTPVTSLQDNRVGWTNLLTESMSLGLSSGRKTRSERRRLETQAAIDRQFWQNINRVRVSGGGDTTYALVKDDIGNWYVKGYSGDPKEVIKGFQSIALAAASGALGADLIGRAKQVEKERQGGQAAESAPSPTALGAHVKRFTARYEADTEKDAKELQDAVNGLAKDEGAAVKDSWTKVPGWDQVAALKEKGALRIDELLGLVADPAAHLVKDLGDVPEKKGEEQAEHCLELLERVATFEEELLQRLLVVQLVNAEEDDDGAARNLVLALRRSVGERVGGTARRFLDRRNDTVGDYETALFVLGERPEAKKP